MKNFLENYKNKVCKTWIGKALQILVFNTLIKLIICVVCAIIAAIGINANSDLLIFTILGWIGFGGLTLIAAVFMVYAWIINPLQDLKARKK